MIATDARPVPLSRETHGRGPHVLLLHGVGLDRGMWRRCLPALAAEHRVTLVDLRGHGASPPAAPGLTLPALAADLATLLDGPGPAWHSAPGAAARAPAPPDRRDATATPTDAAALLDGAGLAGRPSAAAPAAAPRGAERLAGGGACRQDAAPALAAASLRGDLAAPAAGGTTSADGPVHVVGFSLGALVGQELALARPDLVASLTLVSSVADRSSEERVAVAARRERARADFAASAGAAVDRWFSPAWRAREPDLARAVLGTLLANDPGSYLACYDVFATADAALWPRLPGIAAPTLAVTGAEDPGSTPAMSRRLAARIPGARAMIVPGARHLLPLERPDELAAAILAHIAPCPDRSPAEERHSV